MDWTAPINAYCERTDHTYWAEPINAISNIAFIIAAVGALWLYRTRLSEDRGALLLIGIVFAVGIGSFLFHTHANRWSLLADVIPIMLFIYCYFFLAMRRMIGLGVLAALAMLVAYTAFSFGFNAVVPRGFLHGSASYLPALFALLAVGFTLRAQGHPSAASLFAAAGVFAVSLTFRTLDLAVCDLVPVGTHFLWHALNGVLLFLLVRAMINAADFAPVLSRPQRAAT